MMKGISLSIFRLRWKPLKNTIKLGDIMTKEIKSIYGDSYEVTNKYSETVNPGEEVPFCGDCFKCKNMCENGIHMVSAYTDFKGA